MSTTITRPSPHMDSTKSARAAKTAKTTKTTKTTKTAVPAPCPTRKDESPAKTATAIARFKGNKPKFRQNRQCLLPASRNSTQNCGKIGNTACLPHTKQRITGKNGKNGKALSSPTTQNDNCGKNGNHGKNGNRVGNGWGR